MVFDLVGAIKEMLGSESGKVMAAQAATQVSQQRKRGSVSIRLIAGDIFFLVLAHFGGLFYLCRRLHKREWSGDDV